MLHSSSSAKSLVQLGNTFTQSGCGCLKKCLQLSKLLPLPSHKLHTFPKIHKKKKKKAVCPVRPRVLSSWGIPSLRAAVDAWKGVCSSQNYSHYHPTNSTHFQKSTKKKKRFVQFGQTSCPAGEYLHSERLWMLEKMSAALKTTPTTIPHISKNPQKKSWPRVLSSWGMSLLGCLKKYLQLSILLPLPSHKLHTFPNIHKKKKLWNYFVREAEGCRWELKARNSAVQLCACHYTALHYNPQDGKMQKIAI